jgi:hypothetical protein
MRAGEDIISEQRNTSDTLWDVRSQGPFLIPLSLPVCLPRALPCPSLNLAPLGSSSTQAGPIRSVHTVKQ